MNKKCLYCGQWYSASRSDQMYCCSRCRQRSYSLQGDLIIPIKKKWFDMIKAGIKKEEYREIKPYWTKRFTNYFGRLFNTNSEKDDFGEMPKWLWTKEKKIVRFRNGYGNNVPEIICECTLKEGYGKKEWGAEMGERYYILTITRIL